MHSHIRRMTSGLTASIAGAAPGLVPYPVKALGVGALRLYYLKFERGSFDVRLTAALSE